MEQEIVKEPSRNSTYRFIETKFWTDKKTKQTTPNQKLLMLYFVTNSHAHISGLYHLPLILIVHETGIASEEILGDITDLEKLSYSQYDHDNETVWVRNMLRHQGRGAKIRQAVEYHLQTIESQKLITAFLDYYNGWGIKYRIRWVSKPKGGGLVRGGAFHALSLKGTESTESTKDLQALGIESIATTNGATPEELFIRFWAMYPRKVAKQAAVKAWIKLSPDTEATARLLQALDTQTRSPQWLREGGQYIPHPATWLNGRRWEDEVEGAQASRGLSEPVRKLKESLAHE